MFSKQLLSKLVCRLPSLPYQQIRQKKQHQTAVVTHVQSCISSHSQSSLLPLLLMHNIHVIAKFLVWILTSKILNSENLTLTRRPMPAAITTLFKPDFWPFDLGGDTCWSIAVEYISGDSEAVFLQHRQTQSHAADHPTPTPQQLLVWVTDNWKNEMSLGCIGCVLCADLIHHSETRWREAVSGW